MKNKLAIALVILTAVILCLGIILRLATPQAWPIPEGTLKAKKVEIGGQAFAMIEGEAMNYLGQVQSINVELNAESKKLIVDRCLIRWNPFTKITVNNQWPVFYPLDSAKPGKYSVVYKTVAGEATAGTFDVP
jgi:hypothetical protein